ncbi:MAG: DUF177 domain-containing protein [Oscillospiraceae bacterium]|nr:DUF177 domain-containing protein [Oscillospiraceae bacterium]
MRLDLREIIEIPGGSVPFSCDLDTDRLDFPSVAAYRTRPHAEGRVYNEAGVLHLEGELRAEMTCICDRCGREFDSVKETPLQATIVEEESEEYPELFVLDGNEIDLDDVLGTCFILDMETKFLCREDCKGLCSTCGKNLNDGPCGCRKQTDPRFAVLEQLLDND